MSPAMPSPLPGLPGVLGITILAASAEGVEATLTVAARHLAPTGYLHAGAAVTLADTVCGYGCLAALPDRKAGFTTVQLASNHVGTAAVGQQLRAVATPVHLGRTTQVWDAVVTADQYGDSAGTPRPIAVFRCTQLLLDERAEDRAPQPGSGPTGGSGLSLFLLSLG